MLNVEERFFVPTELDRYALDLSLLEVAPYLFVGNIILESTNIICFDCFLIVFSVSRDGDWIEHAHEVGEGLGIAVVWGGRCENHRVTFLGKELSKVATEAGIV